MPVHCVAPSTQLTPSARVSHGRRQVESTLCVRTDRPIFLKSRVSDSARPTDRPAARSAARKILGRNTRPTDPLGPRPSRSEAIFNQLCGISPPCGSERPTDRPDSDRLRPVGPSDRPTHSEGVPARKVYFQLTTPIPHTRPYQWLMDDGTKYRHLANHGQRASVRLQAFGPIMTHPAYHSHARAPPWSLREHHSERS